MLLSKAIQGYNFDKGAIYSPNTLETYKIVFNNLIAFLGDKDISRITPEELKNFIHYLQTDYKPKRFDGDDSPISPAYVDLHWKGVRSLFGWTHDTLDLPRPEWKTITYKFETATQFYMYAGYYKDTATITKAHVKNFSVKQISPAQGQLEVEWTPMFNAADVTGQISILTANDQAVALLYYDKTAGQLKAFDGTNTSAVACVPVNGTTYAIKLVWGDSSMQLSVDDTDGTAVTFSGSFPVADDLSVAWESEEWQQVGKIVITPGGAA